MTAAPQSPCPTCGDPRVVSLGASFADDPEPTWLLYACGHWIRVDPRDDVIVTIVVPTEREAAMRRHPSAHANVCPNPRADPGSEVRGG